MWSKTLFQIQYGKYNKSLPQGAIAKIKMKISETRLTGAESELTVLVMVLIVAAEPLAG